MEEERPVEKTTEGAKEKPYWEGKSYAYFSHRDCEYFPCHPGAREEDFNCLFCYCPLYALGRDCGGSFRYTEKGLKDCSLCLLPHLKRNYGYVTGRYPDLVKRMEEMEKRKEPEKKEEISGGSEKG